MRDTDLYGRILGIESPWEVTGVELRLEAGEVEVFVARGGGDSYRCPECGSAASRHDSRRRRWRHLPTCQYRTILTADVPRVRCSEHGVRTIGVPWSDGGSRFTALFEALVIDWLGAASISAVARLLELSWDQVSGVQERAVKRGLERRGSAPASRVLGVDETSFQKRHEYVTVVADLEGEPRVHHVADGRGKDALASYYESLSEAERSRIETVAMDMWPAYISATVSCLPDGGDKIAYDKFHVASHLGDAVNAVRNEEHRQLLRLGDDRLTDTRYLWLYHPDRVPEHRWPRFKELIDGTTKTARCWHLKEVAMMMWETRDRAEALAVFQGWYSWAIRCRLEPMKQVARMIKAHLDGVLNAIERGVTNARLEGINSVIQWLKKSARGYRNRDRFRTAIYFHLGGLDLYPDSLTFHTKP